MKVELGSQTTPPEMPPMTHKEFTQMTSRNHLSGEQASSLAADMRSKWGRKVVESGLQKALPQHNRELNAFFTEEEKEFTDSGGNITPKTLYFCHDPAGLVAKVKELRGIQGETENLVQGDTGQGWLKIGLSVIKKEDLEKDQGVRVSAAGTEYLETGDEAGPSKKATRRTRQQGIGGGSQFSDWGARKMILLAVIPKVPESHHNLSLIFTAIGLNRIPFMLTGDFAFMMPILGLVKGCGGTNPCPLCDQRKTTTGGQGSRWVEGEVDLRTLGSLHTNFVGWSERRGTSAAATMRWKGVCGEPLLEISEAEGRGPDVWLLILIVPAPLHLYLSYNELINFLQKTMWPEVKEVLRDRLGVQCHVYQGKVGNYEGPSIHKILNNLETLEQYMLGGSTMRPFYATFIAFKAVASAVLSAKQLPVDWRERLHHLRTCLLHLHTHHGMNITPKLHILITHVEQWVDRFGRSLGKEGEQQGEAVHHIWKRQRESM